MLARGLLKAILLVSSVTFLILPLGQGAFATGTPGTFHRTGSMTVPRAGHVSVILNDGSVLIVGGDRCGKGPASYQCTSAEIYNPRSGTFRRTGSLNCARAGETATLLRDGTVLVAGGGVRRDGTACPTMNNEDPAPDEIYDPVTGRFRLLPFGLGVSGQTATLLVDGTVLLADGISMRFGIPTSEADLYDPVTGFYNYLGLASKGSAGPGATATLLPNGQVLIAGGEDRFDGDGGPLANAELYDPQTKSFTAVGPMTTQRVNHTATLLQNGQVFIAGGTTEPEFDGPFFGQDTTENFDPKTQSFALSGVMTTARTNQTGTLLSDGEVLLAGGFSSFNGFAANEPLASAELYRSGGSLTLTGRMLQRRYDFTSNLLTNGLVLIAGGRDAHQKPIAEAELYRPSGEINFGAPQNGAIISGSLSIVTEVSSETKREDIYIDSSRIASSRPSTFIWNSALVPNGSHVITAIAFAGTKVLGGNFVNVNVANGPVTLTFPATASTLSGKVAINAQASSSVQRVDFAVDGGVIASSSPLTTYWDSTSVANGRHTISSTAYDSNGPIGNDSVAVTVAN